VVERLVAGRFPGALDVLGRAIAAGPGRWVAIVVGGPGSEEDGALEVGAAVIASTPDGAGEPTLLAWLPLPTEGVWATLARGGEVTSELAEVPRVLASGLEDWDDDGQLELEVVLTYSGAPVCGVGATTYRHYFALETEGTPRVAAAILSGQASEADMGAQLTGTVLHEDTNGDGHRDLVLRSRLCERRDVEAEERTCEPSTRRVFPWDPARGTWMEPPPGSAAAPCDEGGLE
jgi:hypothetical protein